MTTNLIRDVEGETLFDSTWPRCYSCDEQSTDVKPLTYVRADGVRGMSYPECADCRRANAERLQRQGFTVRRHPGGSTT